MDYGIIPGVTGTMRLIDSGSLLPALSLARRELVRFFRQRNRVIGALLTPIVFWLLIGLGVGRSFSAAGVEGGYERYFFPGTVLLTVLFTAIFSTISLIEDRREGFLQGVFVSPAGTGQVVLGKAIGGTALASLQAGVLLILSPIAGVTWTIGSAAMAAAAVLVLAFGMTAGGLAIAWRMTSTQAFHVVMNLLLMPLWLASGALYPLRDDTPAVLAWAMRINPLSYGLSALRESMNGTGVGNVASYGVSLAVTAVAGAMLLASAWIVAAREERSVIA